MEQEEGEQYPVDRLERGDNPCGMGAHALKTAQEHHLREGGAEGAEEEKQANIRESRVIRLNPEHRRQHERGDTVLDGAEKNRRRIPNLFAVPECQQSESEPGKYAPERALKKTVRDIVVRRDERKPGHHEERINQIGSSKRLFSYQRRQTGDKYGECGIGKQPDSDCGEPDRIEERRPVNRQNNA